MVHVDLKPYQLEGAKKIRDFGGRALLADEQGLGKTRQVLYYCLRVARSRPIIVVSPAVAKDVWETEARDHLQMAVEVLSGRKPAKNRLVHIQSIVVLNYDIVRAWLPFLKSLNPQIVIIDEAQYIKNRHSQRSRAVVELCKGVPKVIAMSGTPLTNRPSELWPVLSVLFPKQYSSFVKFAFEYCKPYKAPWGWEYSGAKNLEKLHAELKQSCMIRRLKKEVLPELPDKERIIVPVSLPKVEEYRHAQTHFLEWLQTISLYRAKKAKKAEALTQVGYLLRLSARLKLPIVCEWIDNFLDQSEGKLVVFTCHRKMIEILAARYGREAVVVDGSVTADDRRRAVSSFQKNPKVRVFLGNVRAAGVAITLTAASTFLFTDLPWTPGELVQGEDRIHRIGQTGQKVQIYYLIARGTIEEKLCKLLWKKQSVLNSILDGGQSGDDFDIFRKLLKDMRDEDN